MENNIELLAMSHKTVPKEKFSLFSSFCVYFPFVLIFGKLGLWKGKIKWDVCDLCKGLAYHGPIFSGLYTLGTCLGVFNPGMLLYMPLLGALEKNYDE